MSALNLPNLSRNAPGEKKLFSISLIQRRRSIDICILAYCPSRLLGHLIRLAKKGVLSTYVRERRLNSSHLSFFHSQSSFFGSSLPHLMVLRSIQPPPHALTVVLTAVIKIVFPSPESVGQKDLCCCCDFEFVPAANERSTDKTRPSMY